LGDVADHFEKQDRAGLSICRFVKQISAGGEVAVVEAKWGKGKRPKVFAALSEKKGGKVRREIMARKARELLRKSGPIQSPDTVKAKNLPKAGPGEENDKNGRNCRRERRRKRSHSWEKKRHNGQGKQLKQGRVQQGNHPNVSCHAAK